MKIIIPLIDETGASSAVYGGIFKSKSGFASFDKAALFALNSVRNILGEKFVKLGNKAENFPIEFEKLSEAAAKCSQSIVGINLLLRKYGLFLWFDSIDFVE